MTFGINELDLLKETLEPDVFIVDNILPTGVTLLCGTQKVGKSWLALKLCLCASRGVDLWGLKTLHCKTLYCCLEDTKKRIRKRYDALAESSAELQGSAPTGWMSVEFQCPKLNDGLVETLEQYIVENPECKLIVIDTLLMITPPMNDSPYANDYNNIVALKKFADKHEIAVVLIHHTRKLKAKDPFEEILGTSGLNGAADTMMILTREERGNSIGKLKYTGRDIGDEEIALEFCDGDWRLADEAAQALSFPHLIADLVGDNSEWEGTATDISDATLGEVKKEYVTRKLDEHRDELEQLGYSFTTWKSGDKRNIKIINGKA